MAGKNRKRGSTNETPTSSRRLEQEQEQKEREESSEDEPPPSNPQALDQKNMWFKTNTKVTRRVTRSIRSFYNFPYMSWRDSTPEARTQWFNKFKLTNVVQKEFNQACQKRLKQMAYEAAKKKTRPGYMTEVVYAHFLSRRREKKFRQKSKIASANKRKAAEDGVLVPTHHGGSITVAEHATRMAAKAKGKLPSVPELFLETHGKKKEDGSGRELTSKKAKEVYGKYEAKRRELEAEGKSFSDDAIFYDVVGGYKKGHLYGTGSAAEMYYTQPSESTCSKSSTAISYTPGIISQLDSRASQNEQAYTEIQEELRKEKEENNKFREETRKSHEASQKSQEESRIFQDRLLQRLEEMHNLFLANNCSTAFRSLPDPRDPNGSGGSGASVGSQV